MKKNIETIKDIESVDFYKLSTGVLAGVLIVFPNIFVKIIGVLYFICILYFEGKE